MCIIPKLELENLNKMGIHTNILLNKYNARKGVRWKNYAAVVHYDVLH